MLHIVGVLRFILGFSILSLKYESLMKLMALNGGVLVFILSGWLCCLVIKQCHTFDVCVLVLNSQVLWADFIGVSLVLLTSLLIVICILSSWNSYTGMWKLWGCYLYMLEGALINVFLVGDVLSFYVYFELTLIPMFLIVLLLGTGSAKMSAAYQLFMYTLTGSLFMLLSILVLMANVGNTNFMVLNMHTMSRLLENMLWLTIGMALCVKIPMYPFHSWLPQAHVQAPTEGSMILAGILLKLGGFGFMKLNLYLMRFSTLKFSPLVLTLAVMGCIYTSLTTLSQVDLKSVVAYASIGHMSVSVGALFMNSAMGVVGSILLMLGHGLVSAGLFYLVGVMYSSLGTSNISYYGGLYVFMPLYSVMFMLFSFSNISVPGLFTFMAETLMFMAVLSKSLTVGCLLAMVMVLGAGYTMWLVNSFMYGTPSPLISKTTDLSVSEFSMSMTLMLPLIGLGFNRMVIISPLSLEMFSLVLI